MAMNLLPTPLEVGFVRTTPPPCIDILAALPELAQEAKTTIRLHPRRLTAGESLPREASKLGGHLLWPASEPWPFCNEHQLPWVGVLQLRNDDFPELEFKPGTDLLQVLWCPQRGHDQYGSSPEPVVVWRDSAQITSVLDDIPAPHLPTPAEREDAWQQSNLQHDLHWLSLYKTNVDYMRRLTKHAARVPVPSSDTWLPGWFLQMPVQTDEEFAAVCQAAERLLVELGQHYRTPNYAEADFIPRPCRLFPERVMEYPTELTAEQWQRVTARNLGEHDPSELFVADGTKLLGHVPWSQEPEIPLCDRGHVMEHLLSIASWEWDGGNWRRWRPLEEMELYDELRAAGDHDAAMALQSPTGMTLGDAAAKYLFICRECPAWPTKAIIQD